MRFLVADDDPEALRILKSILYTYGHCDTAQDGRPAVELFRKSLVQEKPYDAIILDIRMQQMDGDAALREIRAIEQKYGVKTDDRVQVVILTGISDMSEAMQLLFSMEADAHLTKPINPQEIIYTLSTLGLAVDM